MSEIPPIENFIEVARPGFYLLTEDVSATLARMAERYAGEGRVALLEAARAFAASEPEPDLQSRTEPVLGSDGEQIGWVVAEGQRVEVYPNEDGSYWYGRLVNAGGEIADGPYGQINHDGVLADARRWWSGVPVYEVPDALTDTVHAETNPAATWNGRQRPSVRRLFGR